MAGSGLSVSQVNNMIANDVILRPATNGIVGHGTVSIGGVNIFYDYVYDNQLDFFNGLVRGTIKFMS